MQNDWSEVRQLEMRVELNTCDEIVNSYFLHYNVESQVPLMSSEI